MALGAGGGAAATAVMSAAMLAAQRAGWMGTLPPRKITDAAIDAAGAEEVREPARKGAAAALHFAFGMGAGALFGLLHRRARLPVASPLQGALFGALVWTVSYAGWVPALGIMPPPSRDRRGRPTAMLLSHLVYGSVLGAVVGRR